MLKKNISLILALCLILSTAALPLTGFAEDNSYEFLFLEAEDDKVELKSIFEKIYDPAYHNETFIRTVKGMKALADSSEISDYGAAFKINVKNKDVYSLWVYVRADYFACDEIYFGSNDNEYVHKQVTVKKKWHWLRLGDVILNKGENLIKLAAREELVMIDKFIVTNDLTYTPEGTDITKPSYEDGKKKLIFNLPPVAPTKGEHPRLLVTKEDLPKVRENLTHEENIKMYEHILEIAQLDTDGVLTPTAAYRNTNEVDKYLGCAEANAFLYLVNGTKENGYKAIKVAKNYLETLNIKIGADDITRHTGYAIYIASCVYDWCYDLLTEADKVDFRINMIRHAERLENSWPPVEQHFVTGHGVEAQAFRDHLSMGIALYDEDPEVYNLAAGRIFEKSLAGRNYAYGAQLFTEGTDYGPFRSPYEFLSTIMFDKIGLKNAYSMDQLYTLYGTLYDRLPDGRFVNTGDTSNNSQIGYLTNASASYFFAGNYYKDPYIRKLFFKSTPDGKNITSNRYGVSAPMHLLINDPSVGVADADGLPLTAYFKDPLGTMISKTSWEEGKSTDVMMVKMNAGARTFLNHQHLDSGHFDIYYKGKLAIDSGMYSSLPFNDENGKPVTKLSYGSEHDKNYHKRTIAHNCMLVYDPDEVINYNGSVVNDGGQKGGGGTIPYTLEEVMQPEYQQGKATNYNFGPDLYNPAYSYLKGDLASAYTDKVTDYQRTFMFLNFFDDVYPGALIVFDNITSKDPSFKKTWLLHSQTEPEISGNTATVKRSEWGNHGKMINTTLLPYDARLEKIGGEGREFEVNGVNWKAVPSTEWQDAGKWRLEVTPGRARNQDYFLNVIWVSDNDDSVAPLSVELIQDTKDYVAVKIKDRAVYIRKPSSKMYRDFTVSADGDGEIMYIVNGLKAGRWNVLKNGKVVATDTVTEEKDSFSFNAPAGEYTLSWQYEPELKERNLNYINNMKKDKTDPYDIKLDIYYETFENKPFEENGNIYVDAEEYFDKLQFKYENNKNGELSVTVKNTTSTFVAGSDIAEVTDREGTRSVKLEGVVKLHNGRMYIPVENIAPYICTEASYLSYGKVLSVKRVGIASEEDKSRIFVYDDEDIVKIAMAQWSSHNAAEDGFCSLDNNPGTYWAASGLEEWIEYEFTELSDVSSVELFWNSGNKRKEKFEISLSEDGKEWVEVFRGESDGVTDGFETVKLNKTYKAKYLRIDGHGNSANNWNSLKEIKIHK